MKNLTTEEIIAIIKDSFNECISSSTYTIMDCECSQIEGKEDFLKMVEQKLNN